MNGVRMVCAWCGALLHVKGDGKMVSHGMCELCAKQVMVDAKISVEEAVWQMWFDIGGEG